MNSIAINSIKTSVVLGGFQRTLMRRTSGRGEGDGAAEEGGGQKDKGQEVAENPVNSRRGSIDEWRNSKATESQPTESVSDRRYQ